MLMMFMSSWFYLRVCGLSRIKHREHNGVTMFIFIGFIILNSFKISVPSLLFDDFSLLELNIELCLLYWYVYMLKVVVLNNSYLMHLFKLQNLTLISDNAALSKRILIKMLGVSICFAVNLLLIYILEHQTEYDSLGLFYTALPVR